MLTDYRALGILLTQFGAALLLTAALVSTLLKLKNWQQGEANPEQLMRERQAFLVALLAEFGIWIGFLSVLSFIFFINHSLVDFVRGAMCAAGVLGTNAYGDWVLWSKIAFFLAAIPFSILQNADTQFVHNPFTPVKFWWLLPLVLFIWIDFWLSLLFFNQIEPYVLTACCSAAFVKISNLDAVLEAGSFTSTVMLIWLFLALAISIDAALKRSKPVFYALMACFYAACSVYVWKYFFTRYFYGVEGHYCLHDSFQEAHGSIGYILFIALAYGLIDALGGLVLHFYEAPLFPNTSIFYKNKAFWAWTCTWLLPFLYWLWG